MKLGELAAATDTSTATIKYYIREGLLPPGAKKNQTTSVYGPAHRERLELISALRRLVGLSINQIRTLTTAIDDPGTGILTIMQTAQVLGGGLIPDADGLPEVENPAAEALIDGVVAGQKWPDSPSIARNAAVAVVDELMRLGLDVDEDHLAVIAGAVDAISGSAIDMDDSRDRIVMNVAVGTHRYSRLVLALLQLGHTSHSIARARRDALDHP